MLEFLSKHLSFDSYKCLARFFEKIERISLRADYYLYCRTKIGKSLRGSLNQKAHNFAFPTMAKSAWPWVLLICFLKAPHLIPPHCAIARFFQPFSANQNSFIIALLGAMLTASGIFLTLFYTSMMTAFTNKYPQGNKTIANLFLQASLDDPSLNYCNAYTITIIIALTATPFVAFNSFSVLYVCLLSLCLIFAIPSIAHLLASRTDLEFIASFATDRLLAAAEASTVSHRFHESPTMISFFNQIAAKSLTDLSELMKYAISTDASRKVSPSGLADTLLILLGNYEKRKHLIGNNSCWHMKKREHKRWFESASYEVSLAIDTGTIPLPKDSPSPMEIENQILLMLNAYHKQLISQSRNNELTLSLEKTRIIIRESLEIGQCDWVINYLPDKLNEIFRYTQNFKIATDENFFSVCQILEAYSSIFSSSILAVHKLISELDLNSILYTSFSSFKKEEVLEKGFPICNSNEAITLCARIRNELFVKDSGITPAWFFDKEIKLCAIQEIRTIIVFVEELINMFEANLEASVENSPICSYILILHEAEITKKFNMLVGSAEEALTQLEISKQEWFIKIKERQADYHSKIVKMYPRVIDLYQNENDKYKVQFPDLYGFVYRNYCEELFGDLTKGNLEGFVQQIGALYYMAVLTANDEQNHLLEKPYNDIYKAQAMFSPIVLFLELCGMTFALAELRSDGLNKNSLLSWISQYLKGKPKEIERWDLFLKLGEDTLFGANIYEHLLRWRHILTNVAQEDEQYPKVASYPFQSTQPRDDWSKEILDMIPPKRSYSEHINGCQVFRKYILTPIISDLEKDSHEPSAML